MAESKGKVGSLFFGMTLDTKDFKKRLKDARKNLAKRGKQMREELRAIGRSFKFLVAGAGLASGAMLLFSKETLDAVKAQTLLAESIGTTQAEIAGLTLLTKQWGVDTDSVIDKMREFGGMDEFKRLADEVKNAGDEQAQLNKSIEIFGDEGAKMLTVLQQGSAGFDEMTKRAHELGLALNPRQVEESRVVWDQLADTWDHIRGLSIQIGQRLLKPLGLLAAGTKSFIVTFKKEIIGGFEFAGNMIEKFIKGALNAFIKFGIPFINGFISFANQIGEAFQTLFSWLSPASSSVLGTLTGFFTKIVDFMATIRHSLTFGITKVIQGVINGIASVMHNLSEFIGGQVTTLAFMMESIGAEDEGFGQAVADEFGEQRAALERNRRSFAKPFVDAEKEAFKNMVKIIGENIDKNSKQAEKFKGILANFELSFSNAVEDAGKKSGDAIVEATRGVSKNLAGMIQRGSQAEQNILNNKQDPLLQAANKQTKELEDINTQLMRWDVF